MPLTEEQLGRLKSGLGSPDQVVPSLNQAFQRDPDQYAETLRLSKLNNVPTDVAERNLDEVKRTDRLRVLDLNSLRKDAPKTTDYLNNPDNASVSSDDVENLSEYEKAFGKYKASWYTLRTGKFAGFGTAFAEGVKQGGRGTENLYLDTKERRIIATIERERKAGIPEDEMTYPPEYLAQTRESLVENVGALRAGKQVIEENTPADMSWLESSIRGGAQSVGENLVGLGLTLATGKPIFGLIGVGGLTGARSYGEGAIEGLAPDDKMKYAAAQTAIEVGTEVGPLGILADMVGGKGFLKKAAQFTMSELLGEQIATAGQTAVDVAFDLDKQMAAATSLEEKIDLQMDRQLLTFGATLFGGGGQIGLAAGANYIANAANRRLNGDLEKVAMSLNEQGMIDTAITLAQSSKTRDRAPEQYAQFLKAVGGDTTVTIPAEAIEGLEGLPDYVIPGQDNDIGMELFMRDIAPVEDWIGQIRPHLKMDTRAYSQVEMEKDDRADIRKLMEKAVKSKETLTEAQQIWATVKDQLVATERQGQDTAKYSAQLYPAFATVMSEKLRSRGHDVSPAQVFEDMGFNVTRMNEDIRTWQPEISDEEIADRLARRTQEVTTERRLDVGRRERIAALPPEEQYRRIYRHELTGLNNRRAFEEDVAKHPVVASIDVDSLKAVNDNLGQDAGDAMLKSVAKALDEATGGRAYHISGDEFYVLGDDQADIEQTLQRAREALKTATVQSEKGSLTGLGFSYGLAGDKTSADTAMKEQKATREASGERVGRGELPPGMSAEEILRQSNLDQFAQTMVDNGGTPTPELVTLGNALVSTYGEAHTLLDMTGEEGFTAALGGIRTQDITDQYDVIVTRGVVPKELLSPTGVAVSLDEPISTDQFPHVVSVEGVGYMASDDQDTLVDLAAATGKDVQIIAPQTVTLPVETVETGEITEETFPIEEISSEINAKLDAYQQLLDCLRS